MEILRLVLLEGTGLLRRQPMELQLLMRLGETAKDKPTLVTAQTLRLVAEERAMAFLEQGLGLPMGSLVVDEVGEQAAF